MRDRVDNKAKGIYACLGLTTYRSITTGTKEPVNKSVISGEIIHTPTENAGPKEETEIVRKIQDIVAKDTTVDRISRMVRLNKQVRKLVHKNGEGLK